MDLECFEAKSSAKEFSSPSNQAQSGSIDGSKRTDTPARPDLTGLAASFSQIGFLPLERCFKGFGPAHGRHGRPGQAFSCQSRALSIDISRGCWVGYSINKLTMEADTALSGHAIRHRVGIFAARTPDYEVRPCRLGADWSFRIRPTEKARRPIRP